MLKNKKARDPLPSSFKTTDEFTAFWDMHSTADYPEAFREIKQQVSVRRRQHYRVALTSPLGARLVQRARARGLTLDALVNQILRESLRHPA